MVLKLKIGLQFFFTFLDTDSLSAFMTPEVQFTMYV